MQGKPSLGVGVLRVWVTMFSCNSPLQVQVQQRLGFVGMNRVSMPAFGVVLGRDQRPEALRNCWRHALTPCTEQHPRRSPTALGHTAVAGGRTGEKFKELGDFSQTGRIKCKSPLLTIVSISRSFEAIDASGVDLHIRAGQTNLRSVANSLPEHA